MAMSFAVQRGTCSYDIESGFLECRGAAGARRTGAHPSFPGDLDLWHYTAGCAFP